MWIPIGWAALAIVNRRIARPITNESVAKLSESELVG
jgi:hypothetical protein